MPERRRKRYAREPGPLVKSRWESDERETRERKRKETKGEREEKKKKKKKKMNTNCTSRWLPRSPLG